MHWALAFALVCFGLFLLSLSAWVVYALRQTVKEDRENG